MTTFAAMMMKSFTLQKKSGATDAYIKNSPFLSLSLSRHWIPFFLTSARRAQQAHKSKLSEFAARMHQVRTSAFSTIMSKIKKTLPPLLTTN